MLIMTWVQYVYKVQVLLIYFLFYNLFIWSFTVIHLILSKSKCIFRVLQFSFLSVHFRTKEDVVRDSWLKAKTEIWKSVDLERNRKL